MTVPAPWYKDAVFYEVSTRTFMDGNNDGMGDFKGLTARLDYVQNLGVDCLWLLPMYPSPLGDDGYDIADYRGIHPHLGTLEDFKAFMASAKQRGLKVIADLVLNHTSSAHHWFQEARKGPENPYHDYYVWSDDPHKYKDARIIFVDTETSNWTWDESAQKYYWHRFFSHQPDLNYENPKVKAEMFDVFRYWMELGLDGFRADAIPYLYEQDGTDCENLPQTHVFLKELRAVMDKEYPNAIMLGEANQWPKDVQAYFGDGDELHMSFHFPLMPRMYLSVAKEDRTPLEWILNETPAIPANCQWATFLRNHDELTLEMVTEEERAEMYDVYCPDPLMRSNVGIRRRLWPLMGGDRRKVELMHGLLLSLPGSPVLYYGDELGMGDNYHLPDRFGVRTPMQWNDNRNAGFSDAPTSHLYLPVIQDPPYHYVNINVEAAMATEGSFYNWLRGLLAIRKQHPLFGQGAMTLLSPENRAIFAFIRTLEDQTILVVANLAGTPQAAGLDLADFAGKTPTELEGGGRFQPIAKTPYPITLGPYGFYWLKLENV
jgi:maltose alpha-D-glucosyltransferase/alpha-amylase